MALCWPAWQGVRQWSVAEFYDMGAFRVLTEETRRCLRGAPCARKVGAEWRGCAAPERVMTVARREAISLSQKEVLALFLTWTVIRARYVGSRSRTQWRPVTLKRLCNSLRSRH
jgi:hypothetical protein